MSGLTLADKHADRLRRMRRGVLASARAIHNDLCDRGYSPWDEDSRRRWAYAKEHEFRCALITLTYAPDVEWAPSHIKELCRHYRQWAKRRKAQFSYVWVVETHESGRPHYHLVFWLSGGHTPPMPDEQGWWPHGMSNVTWARSPVGYIVKYASKGHKHSLPDDCRIWGAGGMTAKARAEKTWCTAPKWLRQVTQPGTLIRRAVTQIKETYASGKTSVFNVCAWVSQASGFAFFSPWEYDGASMTGIALRHKGYIEAWSPEGDFFRIPHQNPMEGK